ncbi:right-handed parallel beta-helix repeat-containing protein [Neolewinella aurantiaca]|uniref:Right-handed parallel beta-helix repeat-containing protein n=1 Tax=Neolewinella aurantiaca TaxID=2602767 RepID=A0A5C7FB98_9BACT|nr:right-handed parallel beta-helix repeat-containing protein [Neolewinella aurantiaca]TXF87965.1 right-handed parallel beta-helix repeat-containing protein [Neolewinella aurantiaca]
MTNRSLQLLPLLLLLSVCNLNSLAAAVINLSPTQSDMTPVVREALEGIDDKELTIVLAPGTYRFHNDYAFNEYRFITNHDNGMKNIIFPLKGFDAVTIEGNGAELIFHGQSQPFLFEDCRKVTMKAVTVDWDIPFLFQGKVTAVNAGEGWWEMKPDTEGFSWELNRRGVQFPGVEGFNFSSLGSTLTFDPETRQVAHGAWDASIDPERVEKKENGVLRFYEDLRHFPAVGTIISSKGTKGENRYAPAVEVAGSENILFEGIVIHHALGMGFLFGRTDGITIRNSGVYCREDSPRMVSIIADATHFANCKGEILIEGCRFENMLDDGTNVHGTYVSVDQVISKRKVRVKLEHFQQLGFEFAGADDEVWFIHQPDPARKETNRVVAVERINDRYSDLVFQEDIPSALKRGDILENKTWNPTFTMRGCTIRNHRARNVVLKTPLKIVIEDNDFSSMMSAILFRGETYYWFESGGVEDVTIRNNRFDHCAYSGSEHAVLYITPRLGKGFDPTAPYDRNIRFEDNVITTFDNRIVWADRVDGLSISGNKITKTKAAAQLYPDAPLFELMNCRNVSIENNRYNGDYKYALEADERSRQTLNIGRNKGIKFRVK